MKKLRDVEPGIERFSERIEPLARTPKMGPVLWQLPEWFERDDDTLAGALDVLRRGDTASSSAIRAGSATRSTSCCAGTTWRSRSATIRSARGSRSS